MPAHAGGKEGDQVAQLINRQREREDQRLLEQYPQIESLKAQLINATQHIVNHWLRTDPVGTEIEYHAQQQVIYRAFTFENFEEEPFFDLTPEDKASMALEFESANPGVTEAGKKLEIRVKTVVEYFFREDIIFQQMSAKEKLTTLRRVADHVAFHATALPEDPERLLNGRVTM